VEDQRLRQPQHCRITFLARYAFKKDVCMNQAHAGGGDENHQKTGFKLIPFLFMIMQAEQK
jgi:hypothetical protein